MQEPSSTFASILYSTKLISVQPNEIGVKHKLLSIVASGSNSKKFGSVHS